LSDRIKNFIKLDVPLTHSPAQLCHVDSLSMVLKYMGDEYEPWYIGGTSGRFFGFGYYPTNERVRIGLGSYPLKALLTFLREHRYAFRFDEGRTWKDAFVSLKKYLVNGTPVLVISHMGWLSYNKEYEMFRTMGGVVDHYVVITGFMDDELVYVNDPNPDTPMKNARLPLEDFRIGWGEKLLKLQGLRCPMLVVRRRERSPETKRILVKALRRALRLMKTDRGSMGLAGMRRASEEIPELLRKDAVSMKNSLSEFAFFTFRVAATEANFASRFMDYVARELAIPQLEYSASKLLVASEFFARLRELFMDASRGQVMTGDIANAVKTLLVGAWQAETECFANLDKITRERLPAL